MLINDGFGTHESLELLKFCHENNIILGRILSLTHPDWIRHLEAISDYLFGLHRTTSLKQVLLLP